MNSGNLAKYFSSGAIFFAIIHMLWPSLAIDGITIALLVIAILPWLAPYLKSLELPGGVKIELKDAMKATEKGIVEIHDIKINQDENETISTLSRIAEEDANLALVGFRVELEKRLYKAAEINSISIQSRSLHDMVSELRSSGIIPEPLASSLNELIKLGNKAAHGVTVSKEAAEWVLEKAPAILANVDSHFNLKEQNA